jgi:hypothetical protein
LDKITFSCVETIGIGIFNPRSVSKISGPPELIGKIVAAYEKVEKYCEEMMIELLELRTEEVDVIWRSLGNN